MDNNSDQTSVNSRLYEDEDMEHSLERLLGEKVKVSLPDVRPERRGLLFMHLLPERVRYDL